APAAGELPRLEIQPEEVADPGRGARGGAVPARRAGDVSPVVPVRRPVGQRTPGAGQCPPALCAALGPSDAVTPPGVSSASAREMVLPEMPRGAGFGWRLPVRSPHPRFRLTVGAALLACTAPAPPGGTGPRRGLPIQFGSFGWSR